MPNNPAGSLWSPPALHLNGSHHSSVSARLSCPFGNYKVEQADGQGDHRHRSIVPYRPTTEGHELPAECDANLFTDNWPMATTTTGRQPIGSAKWIICWTPMTGETADVHPKVTKNGQKSIVLNQLGVHPTMVEGELHKGRALVNTGGIFRVGPKRKSGGVRPMTCKSR
uniref:Uncharacterized protein n=1 Tax=Trichuris muris TaxID=70415 RepID=A0A5S6Q6Q7_TRIMR